MYSKKYMNTRRADYTITPPPGYDGSRFRSRSDGRDDAFPPYDAPPQIYRTDRQRSEAKEDESAEDITLELTTDNEASPSNSAPHGFFPFLKDGIGQEELMIIALLIILLTEEKLSAETILMLGLLLCL